MLTGPQVRAGLASLLRGAFRCDEPERVARDHEQCLRRTTVTPYYRRKKCKRMSPLRKRLLLSSPTAELYRSALECSRVH